MLHTRDCSARSNGVGISIALASMTDGIFREHFEYVIIQLSR